MDYFTHLTALLTGVIVLMAGIVIDRNSNQSFLSALYDSFAWGAVYFISFGIEFIFLANN
jgi:hypothetical protein